MTDPTPFLDSTAAAGDGTELNRRMQRDGYLFVRGLLPPEPLETLRLKFLGIARDAGWVARGEPLAEAVADLDGFCVEPQPDYMGVYAEMYKLQEFHALQHHPAILGLLERMCGDGERPKRVSGKSQPDSNRRLREAKPSVIPHPRIIGRTIFPQREAFTTPAHQDFVPIQGTADTWTAWFPLHDLSPEMGGLQVAEGSHTSGVYEFRPALGAGGLEVTDPLEGRWRSSLMNQGDVLFFHSLCVHKGVSNTGRTLRQSIDARFQRLGDPIEEKSLLPHVNPVTWEEIYAGWPNGGFQYYWKDWDLSFIEYDYSYLEERDRLAFEMAAAGDERARSALQRIVARDADPEKRQRAEAALVSLDAS